MMAQYNAQSSYRFKGEVVAQLFLDIDSKDVIQKCELRGPFKNIGLISQSFKGQKLSELAELKMDFDHQDILSLLFVEALRDYRGELTADFEQVTKINSEDVVCFCFGVTKNQLKTFQGKGYDQVVVKTFATSGCGTCHDEVINLISTEVANTYKFQGKTQVEWVNFFKQQLQSSTFKNHKVYTVSRSEVGFIGPLLNFSEQDILKTHLQKVLPFGVHFSFVFLDDKTHKLY